MTSLDELLDDLAAGLERLSRSALSAFFLACGGALLVEYQRWSAHRGESHEDVLRSSRRAVERFLSEGAMTDDGAETLSLLEELAPPGESPDEVSSTYAQDCWICFDTALRVLLDPSFNAGPSIEYALQPVTESVSQVLHGVSQVGSGPEEKTEIGAVIADPRFTEAIEFCRWAIAFLGERPEPSTASIDTLKQRAELALVP